VLSQTRPLSPEAAGFLEPRCMDQDEPLPGPRVQDRGGRPLSRNSRCCWVNSIIALSTGCIVPDRNAPPQRDSSPALGGKGPAGGEPVTGGRGVSGTAATAEGRGHDADHGGDGLRRYAENARRGEPASPCRGGNAFRNTSPDSRAGQPGGNVFAFPACCARRHVRPPSPFLHIPSCDGECYNLRWLFHFR